MAVDNSKKNFDVIVVGSGPAGSAAALFLARRGTEVLLLEKEKLPRYKTCGGGVVSRVLKMLPFEIDDVVEKSCFISEVYDHRIKLKFTTKRSKPIILMTMRDGFDNYLVEKAVRFGAVVKDEHEVRDVVLNSSGSVVITSKGNYEAKFVIAADGATGIIAKKINIKNKLIRLPALEYEIEVKESLYSLFSETARFDFDIIPDGYGWVFPKKDHLSVGVVSMKKGSSNLYNLFNEYLKILGIDEIINMEKHGYLIPITQSRKKFAEDRILFAGDSAGFADPVTAEGISGAVQSGSLAAESIMNNNFDEKLVADAYNVAVANSILKEHKYSRIISNFVYKYPGVRSFLFKLYGQKLSELITDIFTGDKKYSDLLSDPANYLKLIKYLFFRKAKHAKKETPASLYFGR